MAAKASALDVDQVMLDLEDAIAPSAKPQARQQAKESIDRFDWSGKILSLRVNDVTTPWFERDVLDVVAAVGHKLDTIVLPKASQPSDVRTLALLLARVERERNFTRAIGIEPQIESAQGLTAVEAIAAAHERVESLTFGPADFAASIGSPVLTIGGHATEYPGHVWHYALSRIVVAARTFGLAAIDGPYGALRDERALLESATMARALGCDGKWAIHPDQIATIARVFTPSDDEVARARRIAEQYEGASSSGASGAVSYEGELVDAASARLAQTILKHAPKTPDP